MRIMKQVVLLAGLFFVMTANTLVAKKEATVSITTLHRATVVPVGKSANIVLIVRMEKHERNWELTVSCDGIDGGMSTSSERSFWNGEKQDEIYDFGFDLSPATYRCEVVLKRKQMDGKMKEFTSSVEVTIY